MSLTLTVVNASESVISALAPLEKDERHRVLLAAAVLYGIITPGEPAPPNRASIPARRGDPGDSIRERVLRELMALQTASSQTLATNTGAKLESVRAALSKLVAEGKARRVGSNTYDLCSDSPKSAGS